MVNATPLHTEKMNPYFYSMLAKIPGKSQKVTKLRLFIILFSLSVCNFIGTVGELHVPLEVCGAVVKREFDYWMINENHIKSCCWSNYRTYIENQRILEAFNTSVLTDKKIPETDHLEGWDRYRTKVWYILEYPGTSRTALCYICLAIFMIVNPHGPVAYRDNKPLHLCESES